METADTRNTFRLDVSLNSLLTQPAKRSSVEPAAGPPLPDPVFPQHPEYLGDAAAEPASPPEQRRWELRHIRRTFRMGRTMDKIPPVAWRLSPDHRLFIYGMEVQS